MPSVRAGATMEPKNAARFGTTRRFLRAVFRAVVRANDAEWPFERGFRSAKLEMMIPKLLFTTPSFERWVVLCLLRGCFFDPRFCFIFFAKLIFLGEKRYFKKNQSTKTERSSSHKKETDLFFFLSSFFLSPHVKNIIVYVHINSPSPSPRLSRLTSTRNSVPTRWGESSIIPFGNEKNAEREVIHGRWAVLGHWRPDRRNGTGIRGSPRVPCAPRMTAPPSRTSSRRRRPAGAGRLWLPVLLNVLIIETILVAVPKRTELAWLTRSLINSPSMSPRWPIRPVVLGRIW